MKTDSITSKAYSSQYTSFEITKSFPERLDSEKEYSNLVQETLKNVHYGSLIFDSEHNVYWRFSKEMDRMKGDTLIYKNVLTAFDPQFNQLYEELLPEEFIIPYKAHVRKGMIYTFLNIDDEVAFVRVNYPPTAGADGLGFGGHRLAQWQRLIPFLFFIRLHPTTR